MEKITFDLVLEKKDKLKILKHSIIAGIFLSYLFILTILFAIFKNDIQGVILYLYLIPFFLFMILYSLAKYKYSFITDYEKKGNIIFDEDSIKIYKKDFEEIIELKDKKVVLKYNFIRGKGLGTYSNIFNGISEINIEKNIYYFLILSFEDEANLKKILKKWNEQKIRFSIASVSPLRLRLQEPVYKKK